MLLTHWLQILGQSRFRSRHVKRVPARSRRRTSRLAHGPSPACMESLEDRRLLSAPHPLDLSTLDGTTGFRLEGINAGDRAGRSVSSAGDVNGDGFDDLVIGAYRADPAVHRTEPYWRDPSSDANAGESYVVFGKSSGFGSVINLGSAHGTIGFRLDGFDGEDHFGRSVSSAGDVNGDGFDDLIIGASGAGYEDQLEFLSDERGESHVVLGNSSGSFGSDRFRFVGPHRGGYLGRSVSSAGDVNGDGFDDLIIGEPGTSCWWEPYPPLSQRGKTYVVFGNSSGCSTTSLHRLDGTSGSRLDGISSGDHSGGSVSSAGDVNGDGFDDLIIGAAWGDPDGKGGAGETYVVFGGNFTGGTETQVGDATANTLTATQGAGAIDILVGGLGNDTLIGDGRSDVLRGGEGNDTLAIPDADFSDTRRLVGGSGTDTLRLDGSGIRLDLTRISDNRIVNVEVIDISGRGANTLHLNFREVVNLSSDSNTLLVRGNTGDKVSIGIDWLLGGTEIVGAETFDVFTQDAAILKIQQSVEIWNNAVPLDLDWLDGTTGFRIDGIDAGDLSGCAVSNAGDVNGDGFDDLIIGAAWADPGGDERAGESYVVFGGYSALRVDAQVGDATANTLTATRGAKAIDILVGGLGNDTLIGDGGADVLRGGEGDDTLAIADADFSGTRRLHGGSGTDTLRLDGWRAITLDLTAIPDNRIVDIEVIDITGSGADTLTLDFQEVVNLSSDSNTLLVRGNVRDEVNIGVGWLQSGTEIIGADTFVVFTQGATTLKIQQGIHNWHHARLLDLNTLDGTNGFRLDGINASDYSGRSVSSAGDVNGDGFDDLIIRAYGPAGGPGKSYVVFGKSGVFGSAFDLSTLDGTIGFRLDGVDWGDYSGFSVSSVGDLNGDGFDDLIIGAHGGGPPTWERATWCSGSRAVSARHLT